jgi:hypothetical protein
MKTALIRGAGGFIGGHLVEKLKRESYRVRGVDIKHHELGDTQADELLLLDLREPHNCWQASPFVIPSLSRNRALPSTKSKGSPPIWAAWASSTPPNATSCTTALSSTST